ncbi:MAG: hypothetical protein Q9165_001170 [Trypethelium subeluteriae]
MAREDIISSAVSFLQDPSVAAAPLEKRIAFLQSKNLTQEEIDLSLVRASEDASQPTAVPPPGSPNSSYAYSPQPMRPPSPYGPYQAGYWPPPPPPEPPRRDWRDWFIMATVMSGVSYGVYFVAKRYITPLIAPPTPPQLESDKASLDASFARAFTLIEQLSTDTAALKASEEARTQRLDTALGELESVIGEFKEGSRRREEEGRRLGDEVRGLKDLVPRALEAQGKEKDERLRELGAELKSLKTLVGNRVGGAGPASGPGAGASGPTPGTRPGTGVNGVEGRANTGSVTAVGSGVGTGRSTPNAQQQDASSSSATSIPVGGGVMGSPSPAVEEGRANSMSSLPDRTSQSIPYNRFPGRAAIPAWQMSASKKNQDSSEKKDTSESGTIEESTPTS